MTLTELTEQDLAKLPKQDSHFVLGKRIEISLPEAFKQLVACAEYFVLNKNAIKVVGKAFLPQAPTKFLGVLKEVGALVFPFHPASEAGLEIAKIKPTFLEALSKYISFHIGQPIKITIGACCSVVVWSESGSETEPNPTWLQVQIDRLNAEEWDNQFDCG